MAEKLLEHALAAEEEPLRSLQVVSAGISAYENEPASPNSVRALKSVGLDLSKHRSRSLDEDLVRRSLYIFCMTANHRMMIELQFGDKAPPIYLFRELMPGIRDYEIPDPFGGTLDAYVACRDSMVEAIPSIVKFLKESLRPKQ